MNNFKIQSVWRNSLKRKVRIIRNFIEHIVRAYTAKLDCKPLKEENLFSHSFIYFESNVYNLFQNHIEIEQMQLYNRLRKWMTLILNSYLCTFNEVVVDSTSKSASSYFKIWQEDDKNKYSRHSIFRFTCLICLVTSQVQSHHAYQRYLKMH